MRALILISFLFLGCATTHKEIAPPKQALLVLTTDFGLKDGAVSAIKGVAYGVSPSLTISDLSHEIPPFHIWDAAYRLQQTYKYWPAGTVFVTVIDPGVGSSRRSLAIRLKNGQIFVGPDNGYLTLVMEDAGGAESIRVLDESLMRRKGSEESYTFHGRDLYGFVGARLASGQLRFEDSGRVLESAPVLLDYQRASVKDGRIWGTIPVLDPNYGNVWTNIPKAMVVSKFNGAKDLKLEIRNKNKLVYQGRLPLRDTFAGVPEGKPLLYFNSLLNLAIAINMGDFAQQHKIGSGADWNIVVSR